MSDNTYGLLGLHLKRLNDKFGKHIKPDTLFLNLCDYWNEYHNPNKQFLFYHDHLMWKSEMNIRNEWPKVLPNASIDLEKCKQEEEIFDPTKFKEESDSKRYFKLLLDWKQENDYFHLLEKPYLRFGPHRHKKVLMKPRPTIRG